MEAFAEAKKTIDEKIYLVICGRGDFVPTLKSLAKEHRIEDDVLFLGWVEDDVLEALFAHAEFLAFPSIIEGFGLPVMESMQKNCAVLTSNLEPMKSIAGEAAYYVDPYDIRNMAEGIKELLSKKHLLESLREKGLKRSADFSWEKTARETLKTYTLPQEEERRARKTA